MYHALSSLLKDTNREQVEQSFVKFLIEHEGILTDNHQKTLVISFIKLFLCMQPQDGHHLMNTPDTDNVALSLSRCSLQS